MANDKPNRTTQQAKDQQVIQGITKDLSKVASIPAGGTTYTPKTLAAFVQSRIDAANAVAADKAQWQASVKAYEAVNQQANVVVHDLKQFVIGLFGANGQQLADFGFTPKKKATLTSQQKVAAVAKRAATRKARGTLGPKAKLSIKGTVDTTAPASGATPAAPAVPATPANPVQTTATPSAAPAAAPNLVPAQLQAPAVPAIGTTPPAATPEAQPAVAAATPAKAS